jgi:hypothetical protein
MSSQYQTAIEAGYSPEEINAFLAKKNPNYQKAIEAGYSPEEIQSYFSKKVKPQENLVENIARQVGRTGARVAETALGTPRAFGELLESAIPEERVKRLAGKVGLREPVEKGYEFAKKYAPYKLFPKSEDVRDFFKFISGGKTEPKNEWEAKTDELISDFAALALPVPGAKFKVLKPALLALGGNIASEAVGRLGGGEKEKTYAKLGTILTGSMINPRAAENLKNDLYSQARQSRPADAQISAKNLVKNSESFEKELLKGDPGATSKRKSLDLIKDIKAKTKSGKINVDELEQFKIDINEARTGLYETFKSDKVGRKRAKRNLDTLSKFIDKSLTEYGKENPEWEAFYRPANEVHGAIAESKKARNFILRLMKKYGHHALLPLVGAGHLVGAAQTLEGVAATAGLGAAAVAGGEIIAKIKKSPSLTKLYVTLINSALKEDAVAVEQILKKMEKELED